jgi:acryloyl-coenzyme A reductase
VPEGVPLEAASFAACVVSTIVRGVKKIGVSPGQLIVVTGAGGGIGVHALQVVKAYGAKAVAVTRPEKAEVVAKYADYVATSPKFSEEVKRLGGADGAVESVGGPTLEQTIRSLKAGGRIALIGNVDPNPQPIPLGLPLLKEVEILPVLSGRRSDLEEALALMAKGLVKPVYSVHKFEELPRLIAETPQSKHLGRRVVAL